MSIVFFGTPSYAVPTLEMLISEGEDLALVVTQPDRIGGRGHRAISPPVKKVAEKRGIEVIQPEDIRKEGFTERLEEIKPEFIVVVAYGRILTKDILRIPPGGCVNVHFSLLPKYRGAAPVQWAIINGEDKTGVTTMLMDEGLDSGDILLQREIEIRRTDNAEALYERLSVTGAELLIRTIEGIRNGSITPVPQSGEPSYAPRLRKEEGLINWTLSADMIFNRIRGLYPWPTAYTYLGGRMIRILRADVLDGRGNPGEVVQSEKDRLVVATGQGLLELLEVQMEGKRPMEIKPFLQGVGRNIRVGDRLG
jgi:methionyl-tRNA formyltransferase